MVALSLRRELSRRFYVTSRMARTGAVRLAYLAYASAIGCGEEQPPTGDEWRALLRRLEALFDADWRDAEEGHYPHALIEQLPWREYANAAPQLIADLRQTRQRSLREDFRELPGEASSERYPDYYARNFHFQTDGYLGHTSAALYDLQVELLFGGTADAMRRRLLRPIALFARAQECSPTRPLRILDVACGTGHLLQMLGAARLGATRLCGLDLSPHYLARARTTLPREIEVSLVCDNAERLPFQSGHFDVATNLFLLHEIPGDVRARVLAELARVVRPGGLVVAADSIQLADAPELRQQILDFPARYHEPYYLEYVNGDLAGDLRGAGLRVLEQRSFFLTKVVTAERPRA